MLLDRISLKREAKDIVKCARVSAYGFTLLFLAISWLLNGLSDFVSLNEDMVYNIYYTTGVDLSFLILHRAFSPLLVTFVTVIVALLGVLLGAGYYLYQLGIRRGEEMPYLTLFDGFSFAGKLILLALVRYIFVFLWSLLFIVPGIIAAYRYRFAVYNLSRLLDPALARRFSLELGDDTRIRAHQCLLHASSHHLSPILLHLLLGEGYHLSWLDKALSLLYLHLLMSHYLF